MLFTSFSFVLLVIITFCLYYLFKGEKTQIFTLILASFIFYAANYPALLLLLIFSIVINILCSYSVAYTKNISTRKKYAILGVVLNLGILAFFKYSPLIGRTFFGNGTINDFFVSIPLPIGISFFTFQGISLVIDTFRTEKNEVDNSIVPAQLNEHIRNTALFISFFPQLVAGPIVKAHEFLPQIKVKTFKDIDILTCFKSLTTGYFLKMVVADNLSSLTYWLVYPQFLAKSSLTLITMLYGYSIQIFADFAGYSLIAIGIAGLFGYKLPANFLFPYISLSFSEFWRRWHISLSTFLKEYLYISLGGNRKGKFRTYINLMLTMILGGLWHGAAWSYAVWGAYHGIALALERLFNDYIEIKIPKFLLVVKGIFIFLVVSIGWLLFKLPEFGHVVKFIKSLFGNSNPHNYLTIVNIFLYSIPVIIYHLLYLTKEHRYENYNKKIEPYIYSLMIFLIIANSGSSADFIYFQF